MQKELEIESMETMPSDENDPV